MKDFEIGEKVEFWVVAASGYWPRPVGEGDGDRLLNGRVTRLDTSDGSFRVIDPSDSFPLWFDQPSTRAAGRKHHHNPSYLRRVGRSEGKPVEPAQPQRGDYALHAVQDEYRRVHAHLTATREKLDTAAVEFERLKTQIENLRKAWPHAPGCGNNKCYSCSALLGGRHIYYCPAIYKGSTVINEDCGTCACGRAESFERALGGES